MIDSRVTDSGRAIRRRRVCDGCDYRFTTFERARATDLMVIKKDGIHDLMASIPVEVEEIEDIMNQSGLH